MTNKEKVSDEARASLHRQKTVFDAAPQFADERKQHAIQRLLSEFSDPDDPTSVIRQFSACVFVGVTPPPEILIAVAEFFKRYLDAKGDISLDRAFGKQKKQGKRQPLKQRLKQEERQQIYWYVWCLRKQAERSGKSLSILGAAADAVEKFHLPIGATSLEKDYIAAKVQPIFDNAYGILREMGFAG